MTNQNRKDAAAVKVFPPGAPLATVGLGLLLQWLVPVGDSLRLPTPERYWLGGIIAVGAFLVFGLWAFLSMRKAGESPNPYKSTSEIVGRGPFRYSRNPMYLQMVLVCIGIGVILSNYWILALSAVCAWVLHRYAILPEEAYLEAKFGDAYTAYKQRVRRWI